MAQPERSLSHGGDLAGAELNDLQGALVRHPAQHSSPYKTGARTTQQRYRRGGFSCARQKLAAGFAHLSNRFAELIEIFQMSNALTCQYHVAERAGHSESAVVDCVVEYQGHCTVGVPGANLRHRPLRITRNHQMANFSMTIERLFEERNAFRTLP